MARARTYMSKEQYARIVSLGNGIAKLKGRGASYTFWKELSTRLDVKRVQDVKGKDFESIWALANKVVRDILYWEP